VVSGDLGSQRLDSRIPGFPGKTTVSHFRVKVSLSVEIK